MAPINVICFSNQKTNISFDIAQRICFEKHSDIYSIISEYIHASNTVDLVIFAKF